MDDEVLLPYILNIVEERPTYGYRRVCALLNRELKSLGLPCVNHKRAYRIMKEHNLLLAQAVPRHESPAHTGKVATDESDRRWCSDGFEITCDNGEKVRTIFVLDCCDREVISFVVSTGGYTGEMAQNAIPGAVERRFGGDKTGKWVEWLTDNGSCFIARETMALARETGLINCFTPVRSPESNGMAEAFVKTIKRDYASWKNISDAKTVMAGMGDWIEDYNEIAPHKGLGWLSPREFRRLGMTSPGEISSGAAPAPKAA